MHEHYLRWQQQPERRSKNCIWWKLRKAIRIVNQILEKFKLNHHPDKTSTGLIQRGLDFLGHHLNHGGLRVAKKTVEQAVTRVRQLYEQGADLVRIGEYVRTWRRWLTSGLGLLSDSWDDPGPATWI